MKKNKLAEIEQNCQESQKLLLQLFEDFKKKVSLSNLTYAAAFGTLLGAIRHKGFIPWDDDIDVIMPMEDLIRLHELYPNNVLMPYQNPFQMPFAKFVHDINNLSDPCFIDIFPVVKTSPKIMKKFYKVKTWMQLGLKYLFHTHFHFRPTAKFFLYVGCIFLTIICPFLLLGWAWLVMPMNPVFDTNKTASDPKILWLLDFPYLRQILNKKQIDYVHMPDDVFQVNASDFNDTQINVSTNPENLLIKWYGPTWHVVNNKVQRYAHKNALVRVNL